MSLLLLFQSAGGGGTDVTVTPGIDTLVLTGFAPTVTATSNVTVTPAIDTLVLTGQAPTVTATSNVSVTPAIDTIVIQGYAPTVTVPTSVSVTPGAGSLQITGYAPEVVSGPDQTSGSKGGAPDPYYYKKRKKKLPEPVSKGFDKDWKPPTPRPVPVVAEEVLARQLKALDTAQAALKRAAIEAERRAREAEEEDEEDVALLLLS